jgi:hypothetical protein
MYSKDFRLKTSKTIGNFLSYLYYSYEQISTSLTKAKIETKSQMCLKNVIEYENSSSKYQASEALNTSSKDLKSDKHRKKNRYRLKTKHAFKTENNPFLDPNLDKMFVPSTMGSSQSTQFFTTDFRANRSPKDRPITHGNKRIATPVTELELKRPGTSYNIAFRTSGM